MPQGLHSGSPLQGSPLVQLDLSLATTTVTVAGTKAYELRHTDAVAARTASAKKLRHTTNRRTAELITTEGCSAAQIQQLGSWDTDAYDKIQEVKDCSSSSCSTLVAAC